MRPIDRALMALDKELDILVNIVTDLASKIVNGIWDYNIYREYSDKARRIKDDVRILVIESIARYQPTASDLLKLINTYEVVYGLYRFTRYALDISRLFSYFRDMIEMNESDCKLEIASRILKIVIEMIQLSIDAYRKHDKELAERVSDMEKDVDAMFREAIEIAHKYRSPCSCLDFSIAIFLERIADHCTYIVQHLV